ncbi:hypothetical protein R4882_004931 [Salmonella enterica]|uniref:hypothetical protein n=1 Tax=Salmonella enterica TaxID=28901 RepID=UPI0003BD4604|nr:hypothetical protein [Salmonella enterica]AUM43200.1 hypothetical protein SEEP1673_025560 [Salmonella enterica subsp. enterica serovar Poona str. ATCC BAA-1673]EDK3302984.1 hypothetical protein [Salmonella enterica subsp. enterica serovar Poona]AUM43259.1 hypothetical protein SEEP1673_025905 [Salmonella enterica subsp. enterica serovar Poona str. ATCC BAA-1673]EAM7164323.1 hypothetical protein [Salmonella enterica]EBH7127862.1 hypothetical protein [Salmonella enterica]
MAMKKPGLHLALPALCLCLSACSHFVPPPLWQTLTGGTSAAPLPEGPDEPDDTLHPPAVAGVPVTKTPALPASVAQASRLTQCQDELRALQGLDRAGWQRNQPLLDEVLAGASRYVMLRPRLSADMRQVMDSVHQAHLARACQKIHADLFSALLKRADNP